MCKVKALISGYIKKYAEMYFKKYRILKTEYEFKCSIKNPLSKRGRGLKKPIYLRGFVDALVEGVVVV